MQCFAKKSATGHQSYLFSVTYHIFCTSLFLIWNRSMLSLALTEFTSPSCVGRWREMYSNVPREIYHNWDKVSLFPLYSAAIQISCPRPSIIGQLTYLHWPPSRTGQ